MLPTEKALRIGQILTYTDEKDTRFLPTATKAGSTTWNGKGGYQAHELYFVSDDKIDYYPDGSQEVELGEILFDESDNIIGIVSHIGGPWNFKGTLQFPKNDDLHNNRHCTFQCKRVIATTDSNLDSELPQIHDRFVQAYVSADGKIDEVQVEYEFSHCVDKDAGKKVYIPKLRNDGTVITHQAKVYTGEEQRMNLMYAISLFATERGLTPTSVEMKEVNDWTDKWIEENL